MAKSRGLCVLDLDGTLDLTKSDLYMDIFRLCKRGMEFVVATGRTNQYVIDACEKYNIIPPRYIIADNGGTIYDNRKKEYLRKTTIDTEIRRTIMRKYLELGGKIEEVRYTDGEKVGGTENDRVRKYYEGEEIVEYKSEEEMLETILNEGDITKITLAGNKKLMKRVMRFIQEQEIECWSDIGATKFPSGSRENYRLDIMSQECSKGKALQFLTEYMEIGNFVCIGNGLNDFSMFKFAIDSEMPIIVVKNFENGVVAKESEDLIKRIEEYISEKGKGGEKIHNLPTIIDYPVNDCLKHIGNNTAKERRRSFARNIKVSVKPQTKIQNRASHRVQERRGR